MDLLNFNLFEDNLFENKTIKIFFDIKTELPKLSIEQQDILNKLEGMPMANVVTNSVAGSGKTTTNLHIAQKFNTKKILLLTYNAKLKIETRERAQKHNLDNLEVQNYHSFCVKYYDERCYDDMVLKNILRKKLPKKHNFSYDIIIIDEAQDVNPIFYELICKIYTDNNLKAQICILGDEYQSIYGFNGADQRYIKFADKIFNLNQLAWESCILSTSFRITHNMALFINKCLLSNQNGLKDRIFANKKSIYKPRYIICDTFGSTLGISNRTVDEILYYFELGYKSEDFFILAPSVSSLKSPVRVLANELSNKHGVPMYIPVSDDEKIDEDIIRGKMVFSSFHQSKGMERKVIIIFNFDNSYFKFYKKDENPDECTNDLYVGVTRGLEHLTVFHHYQNNYLPFLNQEKLQDYTYFEEHIPLNIDEKDNRKIMKTTVTELIKNLPINVIEEAITFFDRELVRNKKSKINIPVKINDKFGSESVAEITGLAIPLYHEYTTKGKITVLLNIRKEHPHLTDIMKIDMNNINEKDILVLSNYWNAMKSGYVFKVNQIKNYEWLSRENLDLCIERMNTLNLSFRCRYEKEMSKEKEVELYNRRIIGHIDCIDNLDIYEYKCVDELVNEHFIQLAVYAYLQEMAGAESPVTNKKYNYYLYNILTDEMYKINSDLERLREMMKFLVWNKYFNKVKITDEEFIEKQNMIFGKYDGVVTTNMRVSYSLF